MHYDEGQQTSSIIRSEKSLLSIITKPHGGFPKMISPVSLFKALRLSPASITWYNLITLKYKSCFDSKTTLGRASAPYFFHLASPQRGLAHTCRIKFWAAPMGIILRRGEARGSYTFHFIHSFIHSSLSRWLSEQFSLFFMCSQDNKSQIKHRLSSVRHDI